MADTAVPNGEMCYKKTDDNMDVDDKDTGRKTDVAIDATPGLLLQTVSDSATSDSSSTPTGAQPSSSATPVQPVTVQDPLHTGLLQSLHTNGTESIDH